MCFGERIPQPVIEDEELGFGQGLQELGVRAVGMRHDELLKKPRALIIADRISVSAGGVSQGTGEIRFAGAGRAADDDVEFFPDPFLLGQMKHLAAVKAAFYREVQVLDDGRLTEPGHSDSPFLFSLLAKVPFPVQQQPESLFKRELPILAVFHLLPQTIQHA